MAEKTENYFLLVSLPLHGHITPMVRFAKILASKLNVRVILATTAIARPRFLNGRISEENKTEISPNLQIEFFEDGLRPEMDRDKCVDQMLDSLPVSGYKNISNLITSLNDRGQRISCVIINPFVPWAVDVAADHSIPCAMLYVQAFSLYAIYDHFHNKMKAFPVDSSEGSAFIKSMEVQGLPLIEEKDFPTFILPSTPQHFRKLISDSMECLKKVKWILGNSFYALEAELLQSWQKSSSSGRVMLPIGPLVPPILLGKEERFEGGIEMWDVEDSCLEWLDKQRPSSVIYVAFGSITVLESKQMENIAVALKNTNRPFLWVIKPTERGMKNGNGNEGMKFLEESIRNGNGMVVPWCRQEKVLMHASIACFISHCGWNSLLEAVVAGVPVVAFPGWTDQPTNAKLLVDVFKTGVRMFTDKDGIVSQKEVERCIYEITEGPKAAEMKQRVIELKMAALESVAEGGSSDQSIDSFISDVKYIIRSLQK